MSILKTFFGDISPETQQDLKQIENFFRKGRDIYLASSNQGASTGADLDANRRQIDNAKQATSSTGATNDGIKKYLTKENALYAGIGAVALFFFAKAR